MTSLRNRTRLGGSSTYRARLKPDHPFHQSFQPGPQRCSAGSRDRAVRAQRSDGVHLREGDVIVVWKLDRLARSTRDLLETMEMIRDADARFESISEAWADTTTHAGKMIMTMFRSIAEFEHDLIRERTSRGRNAAKQRNGRFGRQAESGPG